MSELWRKLFPGAEDGREATGKRIQETSEALKEAVEKGASDDEIKDLTTDYDNAVHGDE